MPDSFLKILKGVQWVIDLAKTYWPITVPAMLHVAPPGAFDMAEIESHLQTVVPAANRIYSIDERMESITLEMEQSNINNEKAIERIVNSLGEIKVAICSLRCARCQTKPPGQQ